ncbi:uncharacterized protein LOC105698667 [Orussus abietinus]|uniref:uncharacterized protein LOC105698667 n=1 Tax=Orussus abietinus TaxID=222816 RepID=UPI000626D77E|nr:uncharacterized protein LOC105698667 [Orussus abietinus]XP_012278552.1 uncharacterized protein LOC105698667 [Orussus abietinus]
MMAVPQAADTACSVKPTLVRRVSDMFKDGNYSGPPSLFRHSSMQRIRHCCQNMNLFPYLLYSFGNSKSHPVAKKVNVCFSFFLKGITERIFFLNSSLKQRVLEGLGTEALSPKKSGRTSLEKVPPKFSKFEKQERKRISIVLTLGVYFALLVLAFQLVGLCSLMLYPEKYTPGFIFLISALVVLAVISLKIMVHDTMAKGYKREKRKLQ